MVVGAHDGQVRLYSERTLTRANTAIPGLGAPITSVDVTYDGKWVVATTKSYIMVVNCTFTVRSPHAQWGSVVRVLACLRACLGLCPRLGCLCLLCASACEGFVIVLRIRPSLQMLKMVLFICTMCVCD